MYYNKDNPQWHLSQDQFLSRDGYYQIVGEYNELCKSMLRADVRDFNSKFYGVKESGTEEEQAAKRKKSTFGIIIIVMVFAGLAAALILKKILIFASVVCLIFLTVGISMIVSGRGEAVESTSKAYLNRFIGSGISLASVLILILIFFRNRFEQAEFFILLFVIVFGIAGFVLLAIGILKALSGKTVYTEEVNATCAGYVRYVSRSEGEHHNMHTYIHTSPLFNYSVGGVQYEAVWDEFVTKEDLDIALGQTVPIKIDPRHPENIMSPVMTSPGLLIFQSVMAILFIGVAIGLGIYTFNGGAKGLTVETQWNPVIEEINGVTETETKPTVLQITDEMIEQYYADKINGKEWYCEIVTVSTLQHAEKGQIIEFTDNTFNAVLYPGNNAPLPPAQLVVFYTVDEDFVEGGYMYKNIFTSGEVGEIEYVGSHGAYQG